MQRTKKTTITLALDSDLLEEVKKEASELNQSLNHRINGIMRRHVVFYRISESHGAAVIHPRLMQLLINEMDESKFISDWNNFGIKFVQGFFSLKGIPFTFENFVKYYLEEMAIYAGIIKTLTRYVDENDGKTCIYLTHSYNEKWSRIIGKVYSLQIEQFLNVHTTMKAMQEGVEIKILEQV